MYYVVKMHGLCPSQLLRVLFHHNKNGLLFPLEMYETSTHFGFLLDLIM